MKSSNIIRSFAIIASLISATFSYGQNYTSSNNGLWTATSNWSGGSIPATSGQSWGTININHNLTLNADYSFSGATLNIALGKQLVVNGDFSISGGATVNVYGTLAITADAILNANFRIYPGGSVKIHGNTTVVNSTYLTIGTSVAPPPYADFVVMGGLRSQSSGDVTVNQNARVAIFGSVTDDGTGGTLFTVNNGGQVYIDDGISFTGGGNKIINNNTTNPYGLYLNGPITNNTANGSTTTNNRGSKATMESTNIPFTNWVNSMSVLPVSLLFFQQANNITESVMLRWATAIEKNFNYFVIERSTDGKKFEEIATVKGTGNSKIRIDYNFEDNTPIIGKSYYRLKSIDFDGSFEYFNIVAVNFEGSRDVTVSPNPSNGSSINLVSNFKASSEVKVQILNNVGTVLHEEIINDFNNRINIQNELKPGTYLVRVATNGFAKVIRVVVD
ncbi:T9SS type A sorting domain-containing protein [Chryseosolibacter indicus]|uniref:T9SS type A sorting domain-containing protein n=1 Tax=Chryseosolibacter indicus TaxID=2782351 RepID=A0ABS5VLT2_9BACT|nr:T9SS type A sorting domain-containing protein [Chryseosolibacter indicus]MBT1701737.1 T9SS type A sorting domain-containing protein [Chryseosolibacter indicus]